MTRAARHHPVPASGGLCGLTIWLLGTDGPDDTDEHRAYQVACQRHPGHQGDCEVTVAGEPTNPAAPVVPVTLTWTPVRSGPRTEAGHRGHERHCAGGIGVERRPIDRILRLCRALGPVGVTTTEDCMTGCGIKDVTYDTDWCIYDVAEDDPPLASGLWSEAAEVLAVLINTYPELYDLAMIDQADAVDTLLADIPDHGDDEGDGEW